MHRINSHVTGAVIADKRMHDNKPGIPIAWVNAVTHSVLSTGSQFHRTLLDTGTKDLAQQAIAAGVPTYLIADDQGVPRRLREWDEQLE